MLFHTKQLRRQKNTSLQIEQQSNTTHTPPNHGQLLASVPHCSTEAQKTITTDTINGTDGTSPLRKNVAFFEAKNSSSCPNKIKHILYRCKCRIVLSIHTPEEAPAVAYKRKRELGLNEGQNTYTTRACTIRGSPEAILDCWFSRPTLSYQKCFFLLAETVDGPTSINNHPPDTNLPEACCTRRCTISHPVTPPTRGISRFIKPHVVWQTIELIFTDIWWIANNNIPRSSQIGMLEHI